MPLNLRHQKCSTPEFMLLDINKDGTVPSLPEGYRWLYVEELQNDKYLKGNAKNELESWDIAWLVNGWISGVAYGT